MEKIDEQIQWYEQNATRKDDDYIKANLKLINDLYNEIEAFEDKMFVDKIIGTFCEIIEVQRDVNNELNNELEAYAYYAAPNQHNFVSTHKLNADDIPPISEVSIIKTENFQNDKQLQDTFTAYCLSNGKSSYTVNDYCSRIKNLWKSFYAEYQQGELPEELEVIKEKITPNNPLLNAYYHIDELNCYISMKIAGAEGNRNWANTRAAFNKLDEFKCSSLRSI